MKKLRILMLCTVAVMISFGLAACEKNDLRVGIVGTKFEAIAEGWADVGTYGDIYSVSLAIDNTQLALPNITGVAFMIYNGNNLLGTAVLKGNRVTEFFSNSELTSVTGNGDGRLALGCYFVSSTGDESLITDDYWTRTPGRTTLVRPATPTKVVAEIFTVENGTNYIYTVQKTVGE